MTKRVRKARSDSQASALEAARRGDLSAARPPTDVVGANRLGSVGKKAYSHYFRSRASWTSADLALIVSAAATAETIDKITTENRGKPTIIETPAGNLVPNPAIKLLAENRKLLAQLLRDAGIRARDGNAQDLSVDVPREHVAAPKAAKKGDDFDTWLGKMQ